MLFTWIHSSSCANTCYFSDGHPSTDVPCDPNALFTQCCESASDCLTNRVCIREVGNNKPSNTTGVEYTRGTCTNRTWTSTLCLQQCRLNQDSPFDPSVYDFRAGGVQIWQCNTQGFGREAKYCCESVAEGQRYYEKKSVVFTLQGAVKGASTTNTLLSTSSATSTLGPTATASITSESVLTSAPTGHPLKADNTKTIGIGAGVGVVVGLMVLVAVTVFFVRRHERKRGNRETREPSISELPGTKTNKQPAEI